MKITLRAARVNVGLNTEDAAKLIGVSTKTLWSWENNKTYPSAKNIKKIEEVYKVSYNDLILG